MTEFSEDEGPTGVHQQTLLLYQRVTASLSQLDAVQQDNFFKLAAAWPRFTTAQQQAAVMFLLMMIPE